MSSVLGQRSFRIQKRWSRLISAISRRSMRIRSRSYQNADGLEWRESSVVRTSWRRKTHLAIALGVEAIKQGYRTAFTSTQGLLASLAKANNSENRLEEKLRALCTPKLLIIDEIGYLPLDRLEPTCSFN